LLNVFAHNISDADEAFLDDALDDRSRLVREVAATLLDALPNSRRAQRMAARATALVHVTGVKRVQLTVTLPDKLDDAARRDGINDAKPGKLGMKAWWLAQMIGATPLAAWTARGHEPTDLIAAATAHREVLLGWTRAAIQQRDRAWLEALSAAAPADVDVVAALGAVDPSSAHRTVAAALDNLKDAQVIRVLAALPGPWPVALSRAAVERVHAMSRPPASIIPVLAIAVDPAIGSNTGLPALDRALEFRRTIDEEFP